MTTKQRERYTSLFENDIEEKMRIAAEEIMDRVKVGLPVYKEEMKFLNSYLGIFGGKCGRAGKRKKQY